MFLPLSIFNTSSDSIVINKTGFYTILKLFDIHFLHRYDEYNFGSKSLEAIVKIATYKLTNEIMTEQELSAASMELFQFRFLLW